MDSLMKQKSFDFAIRIVRLYKYLLQDKREFILGKQILRSGTALGALITEAQNVQSKSDFLHKLSIAQKECDETIYWLQLLHASCILTSPQFQSMYSQASELLKMIRSAILTTKQNMKREKQ